MTEPSGRIRLDKWLFHARFARTRRFAAKLCEAGIRIDGVLVQKPGATVRAGQVLSFALGRHIRVIQVTALAERRGPAAEAQTLYRDLAPPAPATALPADAPF